MAETYVVARANTRNEHIATFKVGAGFIAAGFAIVLVSYVVRAPFLIDISAASTIVGGLLAAGAAEKYRRGK